MSTLADCDKCGKKRPGSRFKTSERVYEHVCGGCKARLVFTPEVKKKFEEDVRAALAGVVLGGRSGGNS